MLMKKLLSALAVSCAVFTSAADAGDAPILPPADWFVHIGGTDAFFDSKLTSSSGLLTGADARANNSITGAIEAGRYVNDNFSISLFADLPTTNDIMAIAPGFIAGQRVSTVTTGTVILGAQYHLDTGSAFTPYLGAGLGYNYVLNQLPNAAVLPGGQLDNSFGGVIQIGADLALSNNVGVFVDVKKMFSTAHFSAPGADGQFQLNPLIVSTGLSLHF